MWYGWAIGPQYTCPTERRACVSQRTARMRVFTLSGGYAGRNMRFAIRSVSPTVGTHSSPIQPFMLNDVFDVPIPNP